MAKNINKMCCSQSKHRLLNLNKKKTLNFIKLAAK